ncbi:helix-turn-helix transcriptional regulator [Saccharopolyspora sp. NPDC000995]
MPNDSTAASIARIHRGPPPEPEPPWQGPERRDDLGSDELVQHLVRALVRRVGELDGSPRGRKPLLDMTELGMRCLLLPVVPKVEEVLSPREREIARMVGLGYTNRSIAAVLDISLYTVSAHMRRIFIKLGVGSRAAMVAALSDNLELYVAD